MNHFKKLPLLLVALLVTFASCNDDEQFGNDCVEAIPRVGKTIIAVGEELEIEFSSSNYEFSYEITAGSDIVELFEKDDSYYIRGKKAGTATISLSTYRGTSQVSITVGLLPSIETNVLAVKDTILISNAGIDDGFSYEITQDDDYIEIVEIDSMQYVVGLAAGAATLSLTNNVGTSEQTITVGLLPSIDTEFLAVKDTIMISNTGMNDGFSYKITQGAECVEIVEIEGIQYIVGIEAGIATLSLTNKIGTSEQSITVGLLPSIETSNVFIGDSVLISNTGMDGEFSYEIIEGDSYIKVTQTDTSQYIKGTGEGDATIILTNNFGTATVTVNVFSKVKIEGDYYVDYQGIRYNINTTDNTASVAGDPDGSYLGANYDVDFSAVDNIITIPANIYYNGNEYPVKSIEGFAFSDGSFYGNLTINELHFAEGSSLETIGEETFSSCDALESVDLSALTALETIGEKAFRYCDALESVDLSALTALETIGYGAFSNSSLSSVDFSGLTALTTIGGNAFSSCNALESVDLSALTALETIGEKAFRNCDALESVDLSDCTVLTTIGEWAFVYCEKLSSVDLSDCTALTTIGYYAFYDCDAAFSTTLPGSGWEPTGIINSSNWGSAFSKK